MTSGKVRLTIATRNAGKTKEFAVLFGDTFDVMDLASAVPVPAVEETGTTFEANAILKAVAASRLLGGLIVADDSGLEVDALGGAPGVYSARYAGERKSDEENIGKLLSELNRVGAFSRRPAARFQCVLAVASRGELLRTFVGTVEGTIVSSPQGTNGFGYDPVFVPNGFTQTFAELDPETKNRISHRAAAVKAMRSAPLPPN